MGLLETIATIGLKASEIVAKASPVVTIAKVLGINIPIQKAEEAAKEPIGKIIGTSIVAGAAALTVAASPSSAVKVAKTVLLPSGTASQVAKGTLARVAVAGVVAGGGAEVLVSGAEKIISGTFSAGKKTGEILSGDKEITSENISDVTKTAGIAIGAGVLGTAAGVIAEKIISNNQTPLGDTSTVEAGTVSTAVPATASEVIAGETTSESFPRTPETIEVSSTKKRRKSSKIKRSPSVSNKIQINIQNKPVGLQMRKYIKQEIYA